MKTLEKIRIAYNNKEYETKLLYPTSEMFPTFKENHVFDENQSIKWNREKVIEENNKKKEALKIYKESQSTLDRKLTEDIIQAIMEENNISEAKAYIVYNYVYQEYHSNFSDLFSYIDDVIDLINKFNEAE